MVVSDGWSDWPALPDLFPVSFPGVKTSRDAFLVDVDLDRLKARVADYFDSSLSHSEIAQRYPGVMKTTARFNALQVRDALLTRGGPVETGFVRHAYRPFDHRWLYWEAETKLLDEKRAEYKPHVFAGNAWMSFNKRPQKGESEPRACATEHIGCHDLIGNATCFFSSWLRDDGLSLHGGHERRQPNLSPAAQRYLGNLGLGVEDLFYYVLAALHDPAYRQANAGALRMEWPRIPLPGWPPWRRRRRGGGARQISRTRPQAGPTARPGTPQLPASTEGALRPEAAAIAVPRHHRRPQHGPATTSPSPPAGATSAPATPSCPARAA